MSSNNNDAAEAADSPESNITSVAIAYNAATNGTDDVEGEAVDTSSCCASCGKAEVDDVKLKECDGCDLVSYCSDECQRDHRQQHETKCKERAADLRDEILFRQPESTHLGDCPICFLPLPLDRDEFLLQACCSKWICHGCVMADSQRQWEENRRLSCPFCRDTILKPEEESDKIEMKREANDPALRHKNYLKKRVAVNDPVALCEWAKDLYEDGDYDGAIKYWKKGAELGNMDAHSYLSNVYRDGEGVEKDEKKVLYHLEEAAIGGHPTARYNLGVCEVNKGRIERAVKHLIIAANLGDDDAIQWLKECYKEGDISKDDFATALRAHQAAGDATKSPQRKAAAKSLAERYFQQSRKNQSKGN